jgi:hypothetical protein
VDFALDVDDCVPGLPAFAPTSIWMTGRTTAEIAEEADN